jgi:uncharacterized protein YggE
MYRSAAGFCALFLLAAGRSAAQPTVSASGTAEVKRSAEALRVQVELLAKGKDLREALTKLRERRESARKQLTDLGAAKDAIDIGEPVVGGEKSAQQQQMEQMMGRLHQSRPAAKPKQALPVIVTAALKADLPLKAADPESLLLAATALQDKIKAADLGGLKDAEKPSAQEAEVLEEMGVAEAQAGEPKRGEPTFQFVARIPAADRDKAAAEAFQRARKEAARLANAAGAGLGGLARLNGGPPGPDPDGINYEQMRQYMAYGGGQQSFGRPLDDGSYEAVSDRPGRVTMRLVLTVEFQLSQSGK